MEALKQEVSVVRECASFDDKKISIFMDENITTTCSARPATTRSLLLALGGVEADKPRRPGVCNGSIVTQRSLVMAQLPSLQSS